MIVAMKSPAIHLAGIGLRIVLHDHEAAQRQSDEAAAMRLMAQGHDPAAPF
jgi:hypothetical protein